VRCGRHGSVASCERGSDVWYRDERFHVVGRAWAWGAVGDEPWITKQCVLDEMNAMRAMI
jgi:hypothetical protein